MVSALTNTWEVTGSNPLIGSYFKNFRCGVVVLGPPNVCGKMHYPIELTIPGVYSARYDDAIMAAPFDGKMRRFVSCSTHVAPRV